MRLNRNAGEPKYALIRLDKLRKRGFPVATPLQISTAIYLHAEDCIETSQPGDPEEFFAIKLKDTCATAALVAYGKEAADFDPEYAKDVWRLAERSGDRHPLHKRPD